MSRQKTTLATKQVYLELKRQQGEQEWWPAESVFEILVGAILTQNTAWTNVEKAIQSLKQHNLLAPNAIIACDQHKLAAYIRSSGYFNVKAKRLRALCEWYLLHGEYKSIAQWSTDKLRQSLLGVHGVGPETADAIILYAFKRPVFVVDAYTLRMFSRLGVVDSNINYEALRAYFEQSLKPDAVLFGEYHAHIVEHGKNVCKVKPNCKECVLSKKCLFYLD